MAKVSLAQIAACVSNIDFEDGTTAGWMVSSDVNLPNYFSNCCYTPTATIYVTNNTMPNDIYTNVPVTAPNGSVFSVKLGNRDFSNAVNIYAGANELQMPVSITADNYLLTYNYSIFLQSCLNSSANQNAAAIIFFLDQYGDTIPCSKQYFNIKSGSNPGFIEDTLPSLAYSVELMYYLPWQSKTIDFSAYIGEFITPYFMVKSCPAGYHGAYMYLDFVCNAQPHQIPCTSNISGNLCAPINLNAYQWTTPSGNNLTSQCISVQQAGTYSVQIPAYAGCSYSPTVLTYTLNQMPVAGFNSKTTCQSLDYIFTDTGTASCNNIWQIQNLPFTSTSVNYHFTSPGNYSVTLISSDCNDLCFDTVVKTITVIAPVEAAFTSLTKSCTGDSVLFINTSVYDNGPIYKWSYGNNQTSDKDPKIAFNSEGIYPVKLVVQDSRGCKDSVIKPIKITDYPNVEIASGNLCMGVTGDFKAIVLNSITVKQWQWDFQNDGIIDENSQNAHIIYPTQGSFLVRLLATSVDGCITDKSININVFPIPHASYLMNTSYNPEINLINNSTTSDSSTLISAVWDFEPNVSIHNLTTAFNYTYSQPGIYNPILTVTNSFGCSDTASHSIIIAASYAVYIPNAFTPNNDGLNDLFKIEYFGIASFEVLIFNRWGSLMYQSKDKDGGWDGKKQGNVCEEGVYVWKITYSEVSGREHVLPGNIDLIQ